MRQAGLDEATERTERRGGMTELKRKMTELKPCPFCGGEAKYIGVDTPKIICTKCEAQITGVRSIGRARGHKEYLCYLWNRRAGEQE